MRQILSAINAIALARLHKQREREKAWNRPINDKWCKWHKRRIWFIHDNYITYSFSIFCSTCGLLGHLKPDATRMWRGHIAIILPSLTFRSYTIRCAMLLLNKSNTIIYCHHLCTKVAKKLDIFSVHETGFNGRSEYDSMKLTGNVASYLYISKKNIHKACQMGSSCV